MTKVEQATSTPELFTKDSLMESIAEEQRDKGILPTVQDNEAYLKTVLGIFDGKQQARTERPTTEKKADSFDDELKARTSREHTPRGAKLASGWELNRDSYTLTREAVPLALGGSAFELKSEPLGVKLLRQRLRVLRSKPEWRARLEQINPYAMQGQLGPEKKREAEAEYIRIIERSNATFGDWKKVKAQPLRFDVGKNTSKAVNDGQG